MSLKRSISVDPDAERLKLEPFVSKEFKIEKIPEEPEDFECLLNFPKEAKKKLIAKQPETIEDDDCVPNCPKDAKKKLLPDNKN